MQHGVADLNVAIDQLNEFQAACFNVRADSARRDFNSECASVLINLLALHQRDLPLAGFAILTVATKKSRLIKNSFSFDSLDFIHGLQSFAADFRMQMQRDNVAGQGRGVILHWSSVLNFVSAFKPSSLPGANSFL